MQKGYITPFSIAGIKRTPSVIPVIASCVLGVVLATAYGIRLALCNPDVSWRPNKNPEPNNEYENKNYRFIMSEPFDVKNYKHPRPRF